MSGGRAALERLLKSSSLPQRERECHAEDERASFAPKGGGNLALADLLGQDA